MPAFRMERGAFRAGWPIAMAGWPEKDEMKLKTVEVDGKQYAEVQDGKPVYLEDDGKEIVFDAIGTRATITRLNGEAKQHRERAEKAEKIAKDFEGIEDPAAARKALETVANLDAKKLVDAGEIEKVKAEIGKAYDTKLTEATTRAEQLEQQLYAEKIGGSFSRSKFVADRLAVPADMVQSVFGKHLKIEDGNVVAYDAHGNKLYSKARPGEAADFDEALEILVDQYPYRDQILKGSGHSGGGTPPGGKPSGSTAKSLADCKTEAEKVAYLETIK